MVRLTRIYTRKGDGGTTRLASGGEVQKDSPRIAAYGSVDELNALLGLVRAEIARHPARDALDVLEQSLARIQQELFNLGSDLATPIEDRRARQPIIEARHVEALENEIDALNEQLSSLDSFVLPGGGPVAAVLHVARTVCRRTERVVLRLSRQEAIGDSVIAYLNRLSDALFVFSREAARAADEPEPLWRPEET